MASFSSSFTLVFFPTLDSGFMFTYVHSYTLCWGGGKWILIVLSVFIAAFYTGHKAA